MKNHITNEQTTSLMIDIKLATQHQLKQLVWSRQQLACIGWPKHLDAISEEAEFQLLSGT